jgi:hypothetical protein
MNPKLLRLRWARSRYSNCMLALVINIQGANDECTSRNAQLVT